ncbi:hypothetical protein L950_0211890 [Sphingobacterium sp. IITKGP-BTPF85]|nr:hypothetical protein L950_0211890 [Sphingobacterium sp. IITKGP-BTPF85]
MLPNDQIHPLNAFFTNLKHFYVELSVLSNSTINITYTFVLEIAKIFLNIDLHHYFTKFIVFILKK